LEKLSVLWVFGVRVLSAFRPLHLHIDGVMLTLDPIGLLVDWAAF